MARTSVFHVGLQGGLLLSACQFKSAPGSASASLNGALFTLGALFLGARPRVPLRLEAKLFFAPSDLMITPPNVSSAIDL
ncbi:hypothetical protein CHELA1G11_11871 [Hyphomicrobiales bacterium]|nr:hypothetical protein CHELA1G11_11871 [Hyphomicrobiales bacterium]